MVLDKLDNLIKLMIKLDKRVIELEEINLSYLSIIDELNNSLSMLTGEVIKEVEEQNKNSEILLAFSDNKSSSGGTGGMKN